MVDENIKQLIIIAEELEAFKYKVYARMNRGDKDFDDFVMNNSPCNYNLGTLVKKIQSGIQTHRIKPCKDSKFRGIECLESSDQLGFFKSEADVRPGHAIWITKDEAEKLFELFIRSGLDAFEGED
ncbi:MAG: hypothetical protein U9O94_08340 [Nanoarchaeota archaeon]|nr:hypothetical protein [Nanoarchaeota archaeon]